MTPPLTLATIDPSSVCFPGVNFDLSLFEDDPTPGLYNVSFSLSGSGIVQSVSTVVLLSLVGDPLQNFSFNQGLFSSCDNTSVYCENMSIVIPDISVLPQGSYDVEIVSPAEAGFCLQTTPLSNGLSLEGACPCAASTDFTPTDICGYEEVVSLNIVGEHFTATTGSYLLSDQTCSFLMSSFALSCIPC